MDNIILKGGGYGRSIGIVTRLRHHYWTGTNDDVLRTNGVGPSDGGLEKPPSRGKRVLNWTKFMKKQLKKEYQMLTQMLARTRRIK
jgi:hypothetical protein